MQNQPYYAHSKKSTSNDANHCKYQLLSAHLDNVSKRCADFASKIDAATEGGIIGKQHDIGKATDGGQNRICKDGPKVDHATAGAMNIYTHTHNALLAACVIGHHGGLPNIGNNLDAIDDTTFMARKKRWENGQIIPPNDDFQLPLIPPLHKATAKSLLAASFKARMLYSCLVDADYLDTELFMDGETPRGIADNLPTLQARLKKKLRSWENPTTEINRMRNEITCACISAAKLPKGLFSLTVPTGGAKTIASLAFGLNHAIENKMDRIIYVVPYTSIIEQNAGEYRKILGEQNVLEHHSGVQFDDDDKKDAAKSPMMLASENWDCPVVVTTAVQFFESIYSNRPSQCRKLHNIANSVIIFDEAQMLPLEHLKPCVAAISDLVEQCNSSVVLCTATQPALNDLLHDFAPSYGVTELCPNVKEYFEKFKRVTFKKVGKVGDSSLAEQLCKHNQVLCIVNSRKAAQNIYEKLPEEGRYHLSTLMCSVHRRKILEEIKYRLKNGLPCRVVSTSLVEAGVDIDFPSVYRELAGLDSILQAAGRCNREGKKPPEESVVTIFERSEPAPKIFATQIDATINALAGNADPADPETVKKYFEYLRIFTGSNIDKTGIIDAFNRGLDGGLMPFRTVAENFHMIDNNTRTIYIPIGKGKELVERLKAGECSKKLYRALGPYSVQVYDNHFSNLDAAGALICANDNNALDDRSAILNDMMLYNENTGLSLNADSGQAYFG